MEALDALSPQQQADAAARECERLCRTNGNPLTKRAFVAQQQQLQGSSSRERIDVRHVPLDPLASPQAQELTDCIALFRPLLRASSVQTTARF